MGYARGAFSLGYVGDLTDPLEIVRPEIANEAPGELENTSELLKTRVDRERENARQKGLQPVDLEGAEILGDKR